VKGGTTEAGVRQKLGRDARPLWIDEAESENPKAKVIMQGLLDLNRQSSSEGGAEIIKGTQSQTGAKTYHVKSCFGFSGINPMLEHLADESRITVLELTRHDAEARAGFAAFVERITRTMTDDFAAGFVARSVWLMPEILDNAKTFSKAVSVHLGNSRVGDQIGTLLAGAFSEMSDKRVSFEAALAWVKEQDWGDTTSVDALTDERRLLNLLVQDRVTVNWGGNSKEDLTVAEVIQIAAGSNGDTMAGAANKELRRRGLSVEDGGLWVSNTHTALKERLKDTPWSSQWARTLRRLPGTKPLDRKEPGIKFAGELARATFVPLDLII
jgi:putative DNA primase/helicase